MAEHMGAIKGGKMRKRQTITVMLWPIILGIIAAVAAFSATNVFPANLEEIATSDAAIVRLQGGQR